MSRTCDLCGSPLGIMKFRYAEGHICRSCYEVVSSGCTSTIRQMKHDELETAYSERKRAFAHMGEFRTTQRVGDFLLIDEERKLICLPNNRRGGGTVRQPEIIAWGDMRSIRLISNPSKEPNELKEVSKTNPNLVFSHLSIEIEADKDRSAVIVFFATPVRARSFAYRQSLGMALRAYDLLNQIAPAAKAGANTKNVDALPASAS